MKALGSEEFSILSLKGNVHVDNAMHLQETLVGEVQVPSMLGGAAQPQLLLINHPLPTITAIWSCRCVSGGWCDGAWCWVASSAVFGKECPIPSRAF